MAAARPLKFPAGTQWRYSDTNYFLLGLILQRMTGKAYGALMHDLVFVPAGMLTASQVNTDSGAPRFAAGYVMQGGRLRRGRPVHPSQSLGGGSLVASLRDLEAFDAGSRGNKTLHLTGPVWRISGLPVPCGRPSHPHDIFPQPMATPNRPPCRPRSPLDT